MVTIDTITSSGLSTALDTSISNYNCCTSSTSFDSFLNAWQVDAGWCEKQHKYCSYCINGICKLINCAYSNTTNKTNKKQTERRTTGMKIVSVKFKNGNGRIYYYKTKIDNLLEGGVYDITVDDKTKYDNYIVVVDSDVDTTSPWVSIPNNLREITKVRLIKAPKKTDGNVENIWINERKGTTVIKWKDGTKTKVCCQNDEEFDPEKGIAMCFMKKAFKNRACFNDIFKKYIGEDYE